MIPVEFSGAADRDLEDVLDYVGEHRPGTAVRLVERLSRACERLGSQPFLGAPCEELAPGLRHLVIRPYAIYYRVTGNRIRVERVLHGRRDATAILGADQEEE